jgi:hypothetical protein
MRSPFSATGVTMLVGSFLTTGGIGGGFLAAHALNNKTAVINAKW